MSVFTYKKTEEGYLFNTDFGQEVVIQIDGQNYPLKDNTLHFSGFGERKFVVAFVVLKGVTLKDFILFRADPFLFVDVLKTKETETNIFVEFQYGKDSDYFLFMRSKTFFINYEFITHVTPKLLLMSQNFAFPKISEPFSNFEFVGSR